MHPKQLVETVETTEQYKTFHHEHPDYFLTTVFSLGDSWKVAYYSPKDDKMVTFTTDPVDKSDPEDVFKKENSVERLSLKDVKIEIETAEKECEIIRAAKYGLHQVTKKIIMLQHHGGVVYNCILLTGTYTVINIKIDAATGTVLSDTITSAMSFQKK